MKALVLASKEEVAGYRKEAESIYTHIMFGSARGCARLAVMEFQANKEGKTIYECMVGRDG